jgi:hypothetical protein
LETIGEEPLMGYKLFVGNEKVYETDVPAEQVAVVRLNTARGEEFVVDVPLTEDRIQVTLDYRDNVNSTFLDMEEERLRRERSDRVEAASPAVQEREENQPSDEEMGIGVDLTPSTMGAIRADEQAVVSGTPLADETMQPAGGLGGGTPENFRLQDQVDESTVPSEAADFDGVRGLTLGESEHPAPSTPPGTTPETPTSAGSTSTSTQDERDLAAKNAGEPMTSWSTSGSSTPNPDANASPQGGPETNPMEPTGGPVGEGDTPGTSTEPGTPSEPGTEHNPPS